MPALEFEGGFDTTLVETRPGITILHFAGKGACAMFAHESGGHRFQRIPPTERRGRVHTSTITVAVMLPRQDTQIVIPDTDLEWKTTKSGGSGGQHINKTESCVVLKHRPTGLIVRCEQERSQQRNREIALVVMQSKLQQAIDETVRANRNERRKVQIGSGMRGDKIRTIRIQEGVVIDHFTGRKISWDRYLKGAIDAFGSVKEG